MVKNSVRKIKQRRKLKSREEKTDLSEEVREDLTEKESTGLSR